ncbi:MAG: CBS domain-containing protein [Candidatus Thermoplasmatota archaeon]
MPLHVPLPSEVRALRRRLGMTQAEVAKSAGVSQPLIARMESGAVDPRASTLRAVLDAMNRAERKSVLLREVMTTPVTSVRVSDTVSVAIRVMREKGISQMPVLSKGAPVGSISDRTVVHALSEAQSADALARMPVGNIMASPFPMAGPDTSVEQAYRLLEDQPAVLVVERGKLVGIVSKADLLTLVH